jgi:GNAT superfamily N-acetyltransferase
VTQSTELQVRLATISDESDVLEAITRLLRELSGDSRHLSDGSRMFRSLIDSPSHGGVIVARTQTDGLLAGVLTFSLQDALRTGGPYCIIQELWVSRDHRRLGVGAAMVHTLDATLPEEVTDIEVGLPGPGFAGLSGTTAFYERSGFTIMGVRARRIRQQEASG